MYLAISSRGMQFYVLLVQGSFISLAEEYHLQRCHHFPSQFVDTQLCIQFVQSDLSKLHIETDRASKRGTSSCWSTTPCQALAVNRPQSKSKHSNFASPERHSTLWRI